MALTLELTRHIRHVRAHFVNASSHTYTYELHNTLNSEVVSDEGSEFEIANRLEWIRMARFFGLANKHQTERHQSVESETQLERPRS